MNFDLIKNMDLNADETATVTEHTDKKNKRKREGGGFHIVTEPEDKLYRVCFLNGEVYKTTHQFLSFTYKEGEL
jgi:hypothetical protein